MKKIIMIGGLMSVLFMGSLLSSEPASVKRLSWKERIAGIPLDKKPGNIAFKNRDEARRNGVSFDACNDFAEGELVVLTGVGGNGRSIQTDGIQRYGIVLNGLGLSPFSSFYVQQEEYQGYRDIDTENIGKLPQASSSSAVSSSSSSSSSVSSYVHQAPGGPVIQDEESELPSYKEAIKK
jgi:hypothetical protein